MILTGKMAGFLEVSGKRRVMEGRKVDHNHEWETGDGTRKNRWERMSFKE
jgi:hypothetical protein